MEFLCCIFESLACCFTICRDIEDIEKYKEKEYKNLETEKENKNLQLIN